MKTLIDELKRREAFWRNAESDPHNIGTAVMVALAEVRGAIESTLNEESTPERKPDGTS